MSKQTVQKTIVYYLVDDDHIHIYRAVGRPGHRTFIEEEQK